MKKIAIVVHGGAGPDSDYIKEHIKEYEEGLREAVNAGYDILEQGGTAVDAVEAAVNYLEDNPLFNAGKGSALNEDAKVEMCASIMDGKERNCGAAAIVKGVRNPVTLARGIMEKTKHVYLGDTGACDFAEQMGLHLEPESYFVTEYQYESYQKAKEEQHGEPTGSSKEKIHKHGTVGAVALDHEGNLAAATSTGGLEFCKRGRIADSSMIGVGTFADNDTCAVSTTGDGEYHMRFVSAFHIAALVEYKGLSIQEAARFLIHEKCNCVDADMGLIAVDK
ncbi:MAG TPA: isoaspartyl peptidase/L-asparaginase, partial [Flavisolibacter sp.]|nr:isoaspartyl peptidase/L-asparaginase [Flavisolibacter sp.]